MIVLSDNHTITTVSSRIRRALPEDIFFAKFIGEEYNSDTFHAFWIAVISDLASCIEADKKYDLSNITRDANEIITTHASDYRIKGVDESWIDALANHLSSVACSAIMIAPDNSPPIIFGLYFNNMIRLMANSNYPGISDCMQDLAFQIAINHADCQISAEQFSDEVHFACS